MKKLTFLVAVLLLSCNTLKAQTYYPFINNSNIWSVANILYYYPIPNYRIITTKAFKFNNDTTSWNGKIYQTLYGTSDPGLMNWYEDFWFGYREENNKVYRSEIYSDTEDLIYDFSLKTGDSVYVDSIYVYQAYAHVTSVDSVLINGMYRKRIQFDLPPDIWIEGIGSLYDPFNPLHWYYMYGSGTELLCVTDSTGNLYMNPEYNSCYLDTTMTKLKEFGSGYNDVKIRNNPMHESTVINTGSNSVRFSSYNLYNSAGVLVRKDKIQNAEFTLYRDNLPGGIYLLRLIGKDTIQNVRIIIQ
jgi:hypothetical protein